MCMFLNSINKSDEWISVLKEEAPSCPAEARPRSAALGWRGVSSDLCSVQTLAEEVFFLLRNAEMQLDLLPQLCLWLACAYTRHHQGGLTK